MKIMAFFLGMNLLLMSAKASADEKEEKGEKAKKHFLKGKALVEEGDYEKAIVELNASYELNPVPVVIYNIAICYDKLHKYANAMKYYRLFFIKKEDLSKEMKKDISDRIEELDEFIGLLALEVDVKGAEVIIDGALVGHTPLEAVFVETGEHDLSLRKVGFHDVKKKFTVVSGETTELTFNMVKVGEGGGEKQKKRLDEKRDEKEHDTGASESGTGKKKPGKRVNAAVFWSLVGLTGAAALSSVVTGALTVKKSRDVGKMYEDEEWQSVRDEGKRLAITTDVLIGISAASGITALVLYFFTDFRKEKKTTISLMPGFESKSVFIGYERSF